MRLIILMTITVFFSFQLMAQQAGPQLSKDKLDEQKVYTTASTNGDAPKLDGLLDDACWGKVDWGGDFIQRQPYEGRAATQQTSFKILYDDKNLYLGIRCHDTDPSKIVRRMSRRDGFEGDWVEVNIDSYFDQQSAFSFTASVSGVKGDEFITSNGRNWDGNWNPIWNFRTSIDSLGWIAEIAIPLSQLRFANKADQVWGLQFTRLDFRKQSRSVWQYIAQNNQNWVSSFGQLRGIKDIKPQKQIEIQPYVLGQAKIFKDDPENPFTDGFGESATVGVDGKVGVTSDLTLDFTINPDFGQVEADPSVVSLDGFRIFFSERRPFFIENRNLFEFRVASAQAGGNFTTDRLFYSRRIGGPPSGFPNLNGGEYANQPTNTSILGAVKFSGKTQQGLSIGLMQALTSKESATINNNGDERKEVVEPLTSYSVTRVQQDFNDGQTILGCVFTGVARNKLTSDLDFLHKSAFSGGLDFSHRWADRAWVFTAKGILSSVQGSQEAITNTQRAFEHSFDRPDADHLSVDTNATSLVGHAGTFKIGKFGGKNNFSFETGLTWRSPKLELNDIGFMSNADDINHFLWAGYRFNEPFSIFRNMGVNYNHYTRLDFGGNHIYQAFNTNAFSNLKNYWSMGTGLTLELRDISNNFLRGGPSMKRPNGAAWSMWVETDGRKPYRFSVNTFQAWGYRKTVKFEDYSFGVTLRPNNAFEISIFPGYSKNGRLVQYVTNLEYNGEPRYINATLDQRTISMSLRLNYTIKPNLTVQYYGSPFISRANYRDFKHIVQPMWDDFFDSFVPINAVYNASDDSYYVDENGDSVNDYDFGNPDFNFIQFRSNLVARWEYIPGSELFLVWSQGTTNFEDPLRDIFPSLLGNIFSGNFTNIFLVKFTYRFRL